VEANFKNKKQIMNTVTFGPKRSVTEQINYALNVHTLMTANASTFATPPIVMVDFLGQITDLQAAQASTLGKALANTTLRDVALATVNSSLKKLAAYVQVVTDGVKELVELSGFGVKVSGPRVYPTVDTPILGMLSNTKLSGEVKARWVPIKNARAYEIQTCKDPITFDGWKQYGHSVGAQKIISNLTPGGITWIRVRAISAAGDSDWSAPVSKRIA
jgi:hypothetical protein